MAKRVKIPGRLESAETGNIVTGADAVMDDDKGKTQVVINSEVDAAIINLAQGKQDNLTFDSAPTEDSPNPVTSAGVYTADKVLSDAIEAILLLIPSAASALNKLVDMQTMNSSIATATASFKGTYNLVSDLHLGVDATHEQIGAALDALSLGADNNDYAFVQVPNSATALTEISKTERFKFNGENWLFEYDLNNSGFTQGQWNAINSGVTSLLVGKLSDLPTNAELTALLAGKQDNLTFDNTPTAGSPNPVKSGGVYARNNEIVELINALDAAKQDVLTFDNAPVQGSPNPVKSGGVYTAISAVQAAIVALDAAKQNVLTFDSTPTLGSPNPVTSSGIKTELNRIDGNVTTLNDLYEALTQSALEIIAPTDTWPVASPATKTIYRVVDRVNTPPQYYSDYMWNGTAMVLMAQYDNAIDDEPTAGSNNLVKGGGVAEVESILQAEGGNTSYIKGADNTYVYIDSKNMLAGHTYQVTLHQTDWNIVPAGDYNQIFSIGYINSNGERENNPSEVVMIQYWQWIQNVRPASQYKVTLPSNKMGIFILAKAANSVKLKFTIQDVTDLVEYAAEQNTKNLRLENLMANGGNLSFINGTNDTQFKKVNVENLIPGHTYKLTLLDLDWSLSGISPTDTQSIFAFGYTNSSVDTALFYINYYMWSHDNIRPNREYYITVPKDSAPDSIYWGGCVASGKVRFAFEDVTGIYEDKPFAIDNCWVGGDHFVYRQGAKSLVVPVKAGDSISFDTKDGDGNTGAVIAFIGYYVPESIESDYYYPSGVVRQVYASNTEYNGTIPNGVSYIVIGDNNGYNQYYSAYNLKINGKEINLSNKHLSDHYPILCDVAFESNDGDYEKLRVMSWNLSCFNLGSMPSNSIDQQILVDTYLPAYKKVFNKANADIIGLEEYDTPFFVGHSDYATRNVLFPNYKYYYEGAAVGDTTPYPWHYQNACYSHLKLSGSTDVNFVSHENVKYFTVSEIKVGGMTVKVACTHLTADSTYQIQPDQIAEIISYFSNDDNVIIMGDFNCQPSDFDAFKEAGYTLANDGYNGLIRTINKDLENPASSPYIDNIIVKGGNINNVSVIDTDEFIGIK